MAMLKLSSPSRIKGLPKDTRPNKGRCRSGCLTCRIRKIKCDEAKPFCNKCTSTGRKCDGYEMVIFAGYRPRCKLSSKSDKINHIAPGAVSSIAPKVKARSHLSHMRPSVYHYNDIEMRALDFYRSRTATALSAYCESDFWETVVLRVSYSEPAVHNAVLSLSMLYEAFEAAGVSQDIDLVPLDSRTLHLKQQAFVHLNKAVGLLANQNLLETTSTSRTLDTVLISCLLFVLHELANYAYGRAINHWIMGLRIITPVPDPKVDSSLIGLFNQMVVQSLFLGPNMLDYEHTPKVESPPLVPFFSFPQARDALYGIFLDAFPLLYRTAPTLQPEIVRPEYATFSDREAVHHYAVFAAQAEHWNDLFEAFLARQETNSHRLVTSKTTTIQLLRLHQTCLRIMLAQTVSPIRHQNSLRYFKRSPSRLSSSDPDSVSSAIESMSRHAMSLIRTILNDPIYELPRYTFDLGLTGPLFYLSTRAPSLSIRHEAISLLEHPRLPVREGLLGRRVCARVSQKILEMETRIMSAEHDIIVDGVGETADNLPAEIEELIQGRHEEIERSNQLITELVRDRLDYDTGQIHDQLPASTSVHEFHGTGMQDTWPYSTDNDTSYLLANQADDIFALCDPIPESPFSSLSTSSAPTSSSVPVSTSPPPAAAASTTTPTSTSTVVVSSSTADHLEPESVEGYTQFDFFGPPTDVKALKILVIRKNAKHEIVRSRMEWTHW